MYNKTIWRPGDIITQNKWENLTKDSSFSQKSYQIPFTFEHKSGYDQGYLSINYIDLINLMENGYFCYFIDDLNHLHNINTIISPDVDFYIGINSLIYDSQWYYQEVSDNLILIYRSTVN